MVNFKIHQIFLTDEEIRDRIRIYSQGYSHNRLNGNYKPASVLLLLIQVEGRTHLLYTRRTQNVVDHKGQVAFPGGSKERIDADDIETALRETREEIGIDPREVNLLGQLPKLTTITHYLVTPVVAWIRWPLDIQLNPTEVERVFLVPLDWLLNPMNSTNKRLLIRDGVIDRVLLFKPFEGEVIWGITARITCSLIKAIGLMNNNTPVK